MVLAVNVGSDKCIGMLDRHLQCRAGIEWVGLLGISRKLAIAALLWLSALPRPVLIAATSAPLGL